MRDWERRPKEGTKAFSAFNRFLELGEGRTRKAIAEQLNLKLGRVNTWATTWNWDSRVRAWDNYILGLQQKAIQKKLEQGAEVWAQRRLDVREQEYEISKKLYEKALKMLQFDPEEQIIIKTERVIKDGVEVDLPTITEIRPNKWGWRDLTAITEAAVKMFRLSSEMEVDHNTLNVNLTVNDKRVEEAKAALEKMTRELLAKVGQGDQKRLLEALPQIVAEEFNVKPELLMLTGKVEDPPIIEGTIIPPVEVLEETVE